MNRLQMQGNWKILKGRFNQGIGVLTGNRSRWRRGAEQEVVGRIQCRTGKTLSTITRNDRHKTHH
jgi:uncharacterized protein YjbJ (UPF0337 family)